MAESRDEMRKSNSSSSIPNFFLRSREGYPTWKFKMRNYLIHEDLWCTIVGYPVSDTTPASIKSKNDSKALAKICLTIDGAAIIHVKCSKTAVEAWESLESAYEDKGMGRRLALERKLYRLSLSDFTDMEAYINAVLTTAQDLSDIDVNIEDSSLAAILLGGLTDKYEPMVMALENSNVPITTSLVKTKLLNEMSKDAPNDSVFQSNAGKPNKKKKSIVCYDCKTPGHKRPDCPLRKKKNKSNLVDKSSVDTLFTALNTGAGSSKDVWYVDSGATKHMTFRKDWYSDINPIDGGKVTVANGEQIKCCGIGNISISTPQNFVKTINEVAFIPDLKVNLISIQKSIEKGFVCVFDKNGCNFYKNNSFCITGDSVLHASPCGGLYKLNCTVNFPHNVDCNYNADDMHHDCLDKYSLWHKRLGHLCRIGMNQLKNHEVGVNFTKVDKSSCIACVQGKQARKPFKKLNPYCKATAPLELIHSDLCGPISTSSFQGNKYVLTFIDDYTRFIFVYFISSKTEVKRKFSTFQAFVENQLGTKIKAIRTDGGGEYVNKEFIDYLSSKGIEHQTTAPYSPQQNGVAERTNRTITEKARSILAQSALPQAYWEDAFQVAVYLKNRSPHRYLSGQIPYDKWFGRRCDLSHLRVFGCRALVHVPSPHRQKLDLKAQEAIFVGYSENPNTYIFRDPIYPRRILKSRDATFFENCFTTLKKNEENVENESSPMFIFKDNSDDEESEFFDCVDHPNWELEPSVPHVPVSSEDVVPSVPPDNMNIYLDEQPEVLERRYPVRNRKPPDFLTYQAASVDSDEPVSYHEAINTENADKWISAMSDEHNSLMKLGTWELVDRPKDKKIIPCKWVYKLKKDAYGNVTKYKARLVVKGYNQTQGVDYYETFAPVIRHSSLRTLFALAAELGLKMRHLDVDTAFLNGELQEEVYMDQPIGFVQKDKENKVCLLRKSLYGLKQAPRAWNKKLDETLLKIGFMGTPSEPCVYTKLFGNEELVVLGVYVDDIIVFYRSDMTLDVILKDLQKYFGLKDLGNLKSYLGLQINCCDNYVNISQKTYILTLLKNFNMTNCKTAKTPLAHRKLEKPSNGESIIAPYQNLIGCLMYLAVNSRPDIAFAVSYLSQFNTCYGKEHWQAAKRILQYLKGTLEYSLTYRKTGELDLHGFCDADWANCTFDRRSYTGYIFKLAGGPVAWEAKKQPTVALSSTEAEYMALTSACKEACYLRRFVSEITGKLSLVKILSDSQSALNLVHNPVHHNRTKHIDTRYHFIREKVSNNIVTLDYLKSIDMPADVLTKPLGPVTHSRCMTNIGLVNKL